jgi:hypothetical protein
MQPNNSGSSHTTVVGVFPDPASARQAVAELRSAGFADNQIGVLAADSRTASEESTNPDSSHTLWEEGAGVGAAAGAATGLGLGLAVAAGLIPAIGPVIAGGTLVALLASAGTGAAAGAVAGGLIGLGVPESDAEHYEQEVRSGRLLVTVHNADERADDARNILRRNNGTVREPTDIGTYGTGLPATPY